METGTTNAIHSLLADHDYVVTERSDTRVRLEARISDAPGYPFELLTAVEYELVPTGISVTHIIINEGNKKAPVAIGTHPYLRVGDWDAKDLSLTIAASEILPLDENYFPTARCEVQGEPESLMYARLVSEAIDHACLTGLTQRDGKYRHALAAPDGQTVELWAGQDFAYVQIYVTDDFPDADSTDANATCTAIAIEPMTAPPNALQSGEGLRWLKPGEQWAPQWGIRLD